MKFANKKELCDTLGKVIAITRSSVVELIGEATSLEEATKNLEVNIDKLIKEASCHSIIKALRGIVYKNEFNKDYDVEYERLMGWIVSDYQGHSKSDKKLLNEHNLVMNVGSMDMFCVINNSHDYKVFKADLEKRVGKRFA